MPKTYVADEKRLALFRHDLLKPLVNAELRDRLAELLIGDEKDFMAAFSKVAIESGRIISRLSQGLDDESTHSLRMACSMLVVADCNAIFPKDFPHAIALLMLKDLHGFQYATIDRSRVAAIDKDDDLLRVPVLRADSVKDFNEGRRSLAWLIEKK